MASAVLKRYTDSQLLATCGKNRRGRGPRFVTRSLGMFFFMHSSRLGRTARIVSCLRDNRSLLRASATTPHARSFSPRLARWCTAGWPSRPGRPGSRAAQLSRAVTSLARPAETSLPPLRNGRVLASFGLKIVDFCWSLPA